MAYSNPKKVVNVEELGYFWTKLKDKVALKAHTHSTDDLDTSKAGALYTSGPSTSGGTDGDVSIGTLPVAQGGTGKTTHTSNSLILGNGTSAVKNLATKSGALYATSENGAPQFGNLPVGQGGTGGAYDDFSKLADAIGSGGNWVDVSTKLKNEMTIKDSNCTINSAKAFIYENRYIYFGIAANYGVAITTWKSIAPYQVPTWAAPKSEVTGVYQVLNQYVGADGILTMTLQGDRPAGFNIGSYFTYPLATPYSS